MLVFSGCHATVLGQVNHNPSFYADESNFDAWLKLAVVAKGLEVLRLIPRYTGWRGDLFFVFVLFVSRVLRKAMAQQRRPCVQLLVVLALAFSAAGPEK